MLRLCGDNVLLPSPIESRDPLDSQVVALGRTAGEDDLLGGAVDEGSDLTPGLLHRRLGVPTI